MSDKRQISRGRWIIAAIAGDLLLALAPAWLGALGLLFAVVLVWRRWARCGGFTLLYALTPGLLIGALRQGRDLLEGLIFASLSMLVWVTALAGWESWLRQRRAGIKMPVSDWNPWAESAPAAQLLRIETPAGDAEFPADSTPHAESGFWTWPDGWRLPMTEGGRLECGAGRWSIVAMAGQAGLWVIDHRKDVCWQLVGWQLAGAADDAPWLEPVGGGSLQRLPEVLTQQPPAAVERSGKQRWPRGVSAPSQEHG